MGGEDQEWYLPVPHHDVPNLKKKLRIIFHFSASLLMLMILLFTCLCSRAVHVEMLDDLSTDSFMNGLRCSASVRGRAKQIFCDQGTNFIGASNEFKKYLKEKLQTQFEECQFIFNSSNAPHCKAASSLDVNPNITPCLTHDITSSLINDITPCLTHDITPCLTNDITPRLTHDITPCPAPLPQTLGLHHDVIPRLAPRRHPSACTTMSSFR